MVRSSSNLVGVFITQGSTFYMVELPIGVPCWEIYGSEVGWIENRGGAAQISSWWDISSTYYWIELIFGQNLLASWFCDLTIQIIEWTSQE